MATPYCLTMIDRFRNGQTQPQRHKLLRLWLRPSFPLGCLALELLQFSQPTGQAVYELLLKKIFCTPAELVFGTTIRLPGEMFDSSKPDDDVVNFVSKLKSHMQSLHPKPPKHHGKRPVFIHPGLLEATHVFSSPRHVTSSTSTPMMALSKSYKGRIKVFSLTSMVNGYLYLLIDANLPSFLTLRTCNYLKPRMANTCYCGT
ncbi:uncharacterized protein TNCV_968931 [Trichonephila clavipes]|nr:uncharacterized protein TNCV_968931 [Trichonephila clavipes]